MTSAEIPSTTSRLHTREFPARYRYYVLGLLFFVAMFNFIDRQILSILQEPIKEDLRLSDSQVGALSLVFTLFYVGASLPLARVADLHVRKTVLAVVLTVWSAMTALGGLAQNVWQLAAARAGVGAGEAGASPTSHSLIADYFPPEYRATAISVYVMGVPIGIMLGLVVGGFVAEAYGWRTAFFVVGLPGVLLAGVIYFTLREPPRGLSEGTQDTGEAPKVREVLNYLWQLHSFRHLVLGAGLQAMVAYGTLQWLPSFFLRVHHMSLSDVALTYGVMVGVAGIIGTVGSGLLADRLARVDKRWYLWICALAMAVATPFSVIALLVGNAWLALALYFIPMILANTFIGVTGAVVQSLSPLRMRSLAAATKTLILNLIGLGFGPFIIGVLSDAFNAGDEGQGLRYAMISLLVINLWAVFHYLQGAKSLPKDLERPSSYDAARRSNTAGTETVAETLSPPAPPQGPQKNAPT